MDSNQVTKILISSEITSQTFLGCFPCDQLPDPHSLHFPISLIVNLDPHQFPGTHWIAIFAYGLKEKVIYFDSLAIPFSGIVFNSFLYAFPGVLYNKRPYQSPLSNTCAHFCICFIYFLSNGLTFDQFLHRLDHSNQPDFFVKYFIRNFPIK